MNKMKRRTGGKQKKQPPGSAGPDPLSHAFTEYWRNVEAGKNHTNAARFVMRDYGIEMNDKQFRRCARRVKENIREVKGVRQGERDYHLIEHLVRHRYKDPIETWEGFDAAFHACGLPRSMLRGVKQFLQATGTTFARDGAAADDDRTGSELATGS